MFIIELAAARIVPRIRWRPPEGEKGTEHFCDLRRVQRRSSDSIVPIAPQRAYDVERHLSGRIEAEFGGRAEWCFGVEHFRTNAVAPQAAAPQAAERNDGPRNA